MMYYMFDAPPLLQPYLVISQRKHSALCSLLNCVFALCAQFLVNSNTTYSTPELICFLYIYWYRPNNNWTDNKILIVNYQIVLTILV